MNTSTESDISSIFLARQPIFDPQVKVCAYELLFRSNEKNAASFIDGEEATAEVMTSALVDIGLENIVGNHPAFINMTYDFLTGELLSSALKDKVVLEILEDVTPDALLIEKLTTLVESGHTLALDDFKYTPEYDPILKLADIVKFDVMELSKTELEDQIELVRPFNVKLLAEKVETKDEFEFCKAIGFQYFQGYFFCKPEIIEGKRPDSNRMLMLNLMSKLQNPEIEIDELEMLINQDASLAYKLLKHINSAFFGIEKDISSMKHAISLAGLDTIKRWTTLSLMSKLGEQKTSELIITALVRANMCQMLGQDDVEREVDQYYTVGLFSVLDALLDMPKEEILDSLPLHQDIKDALIDYSNPLGAILRLVVHYEQCQSPPVESSQESIAVAYYSAILHAEELRSVFQS